MDVRFEVTPNSRIGEVFDALTRGLRIGGDATHVCLVEFIECYGDISESGWQTMDLEEMVAHEHNGLVLAPGVMSTVLKSLIGIGTIGFVLVTTPDMPSECRFLDPCDAEGNALPRCVIAAIRVFDGGPICCQIKEPPFTRETYTRFHIEGEAAGAWSQNSDQT